MEDTKQKADELVEKFREYVWIDYRHDDEPSYSCMVHCAILSTKNIIEVLYKVMEKYQIRTDDTFYCADANAIAEQTEILKELESRI